MIHNGETGGAHLSLSLHYMCERINVTILLRTDYSFR